MMKRILALLMALVMVLGLVACGSKTEAPATEQKEETTTPEATTETPAATEETPAEPEKVTLRWIGAGWSQNDKANKIIEKWNAIHPEIEVQYIELGTTVDEDYLKNLDTMISGGEVVDVTYLTYSDVYHISFFSC